MTTRSITGSSSKKRNAEKEEKISHEKSAPSDSFIKDGEIITTPSLLDSKNACSCNLLEVVKAYNEDKKRRSPDCT